MWSKKPVDGAGASPSARPFQPMDSCQVSVHVRGVRVTLKVLSVDKVLDAALHHLRPAGPQRNATRRVFQRKQRGRATSQERWLDHHLRRPKGCGRNDMERQCRTTFGLGLKNASCESTSVTSCWCCKTLRAFMMRTIAASMAMLRSSSTRR